jgi:serine/threonine-protein kinase
MSDPSLPPSLAPTAVPAPAATSAQASNLPPPPAPVDAPLPQVPGYDVLARLGSGGMGVVYQARHRHLQRLVALKMIRGGAAVEAENLARFRTEAEAVARLQHPHIVQIFEIGDHAGLPFCALEYCAGGALNRKLAGTPLPPREAAALVEQLARAMQAAHAKGIVHRDLKPANVLLAEDGTPKITDFGLAKRLDAAGQTLDGAILGTPSYMAPEQARGQSRELGPACDTYALGAILYETLTGRPPFVADDPTATLALVLYEEPVPPRLLNSRVPRDLEIICLKCLRKEAARRYATALDLAEDLRRWRQGQPIQARPVGRLERTLKWARRHPALAVLLLVSAVALLSLASIGAWLYDTTVRLEDALQLAQSKTAEAHQRAVEALQRENELRQRTAELQVKSEQLQNKTAEAQQLAQASQASEAAATRQAQRSRELRDLALATLKTVVFDLNLELSNRPGLQVLREKLLQKAQEGLEKLAEAAEKWGERDHLTMMTHAELGDVYLSLGNTSKAAEHYGECHKIALALARTDPKNAEAQSDLVVSLDRLGYMSLQLGQLVQAQHYYQQSLQISQALVQTNPKDKVLQRELAVAMNKLGDVSVQLGQAVRARQYYQQGLEISQALARAAPQDTRAQWDLASSFFKLGNVALQDLHPLQARTWLEECLAITKKVQDKQAAVASLQQRIDFCRAAERAAEDLDWALQQKAGAQELLLFRVALLARKGRHADAAETAALLRERTGPDPLPLYRCGWAHAMCLAGVGPDQAAGDRYAAAAFAGLQKAQTAGYFKTVNDTYWLQNHPSFAALRARPEFAAFWQRCSRAGAFSRN